MDIVILAALYVIFESLALIGSRRGPVVQTMTAIGFATFMIVGPWAAVIVATATAFAVRREPLVKRVFNASQYCLAGLPAGLMYEGLGGHFGVGIDDFPGRPPGGLGRQRGLPRRQRRVAHERARHGRTPSGPSPARGHVSRTAIPSLGYGLFGVLMAVLWVGLGLGPVAVLLVLLPLFVARWAFSQYAAQQAAYDAAIRTLVQAVETKDFYTRGHSERVRRGALMIAQGLGMPEDRSTALGYASILHDVGKLGLPTRVLQKSVR